MELLVHSLCGIESGTLVPWCKLSYALNVGILAMRNGLLLERSLHFSNEISLRDDVLQVASLVPLAEMCSELVTVAHAPERLGKDLCSVLVVLDANLVD